ncbi:MAG: DUF3987 domain-containing protein, partial [Planctomycetaceae bacterium]
MSTSTKPLESRAKSGFCRRDVQKSDKSFPTSEAALERLESKHGQRSALWTYQDSDGNPVGMVVRWNTPDGKVIRPLSRNGDGWVIGGIPEPRPLYRLPGLNDADRVFVCEGEKAADAAHSIGLTATTSPHGSQSPEKADWTPLAGKQVVILPDNDDAGRKYADVVTAILSKLTPAPEVKIVELPDLPEKGDIHDWLKDRDAHDSGELRATVEKLADEAPVMPLQRQSGSILRYQPFPTDTLPEPVRGFVKAGSKAIGCDPSFLALPMLTGVGAAIGTTRRLQLKCDWSVPPILWTAVVGESGTAKSPAFRQVMRPVKELQRKARDQHAAELADYQLDLARHEKAMAEWKRNKKTTDDPPTAPNAPLERRYIISDTTVEALAPLLLENPRGLLLIRDELNGWINSFDQYKGGKAGADAAHWLSMFSAESIIVDRKTGVSRTIFVPEAAIWVTGGIQPAILHRALGREHRESGLAARLLLCCPPRRPKRWSDTNIPSETESAIEQMLNRLYDLPASEGVDGKPEAVTVGLTPDAKKRFPQFVNAHGEEQVELTGDLAAAWSKLEEYAARLALVVHFIRWAADDPQLKNVG